MLPASWKGSVPRERVRDRREQLHPFCVRGRVPEYDERIAADHLAVEDAGAVEAGCLDALEERHELGQRRGAGDAHVDADGVGHGGVRFLER